MNNLTEDDLNAIIQHNFNQQIGTLLNDVDSITRVLNLKAEDGSLTGFNDPINSLSTTTLNELITRLKTNLLSNRACEKVRIEIFQALNEVKNEF